MIPFLVHFPGQCTPRRPMESAVHLGDEGGEARFPDSTLLVIRSSLGILVLCG
jgi:hypothetical protein